MSILWVGLGRKSPTSWLHSSEIQSPHFEVGGNEDCGQSAPNDGELRGEKSPVLLSIFIPSGVFIKLDGGGEKGSGLWLKHHTLAVAYPSFI